MNEDLALEFIQKGCKNRKDAAVATQVYVELCEVKRYWDVEYFYNSTLERIHFSAKKKKDEQPSIFVPVSISESLSFSYFQNFCNLSEDLVNQRIYIVIVYADSTCVYYQVINGLANPPEALRKISKGQPNKLDKNLRKNKELLEEAAMYGIPVTFPKKEASKD